MKNIYHFYHIYCGKDCNGNEDSWIEPVSLHCKSLLNYKLYNSLSQFNIGLVGNTLQRDRVKNFISDLGINFNIVTESESGWEQETQNKLWEFSHTNDGYIFYAHSKGSFNVSLQNNNWMRSMTYYHIVNWKQCVDELESHDAVGAYWFDFSSQGAPHLGEPHTGQRWFAGTYWWSHLDKIRSIGHGPTMRTRWDAEVWIGQIPDISVCNLAPGGAAGELVEW